jgi:hypothetical protein
MDEKQPYTGMLGDKSKLEDLKKKGYYRRRTDEEQTCFNEGPKYHQGFN